MVVSFSKIGLHVIANGVKAEALATAPVLCLVDCSTEYIQEVRQHNPTAWIVVRWVFRGDQGAALREPEKAAEAWFAEHKAAILATCGPRTVYQGLNEIGSGVSDLYLRYETMRATLLWEHGVGFGLGAWSVGEPDWYVWPMFAPLIARMGAGDAILLHEYIADASDLEKRWYTARWTDERVAPMVAGHHLIITEWGRDVLIENNVRRGQAGWRGAVHADTMLMETARYNDLLCQSPEVIGACVFTGGVLGEWGAFDANVLWPRIVAGHKEGAAMDVGRLVWEAVRQHLIPLNPDAALERAAAARGLLPASDEVRLQVGAEHLVAQGFRSPTERGKIKVAYCREGQWGAIAWMERDN